MIRTLATTGLTSLAIASLLASCGLFYLPAEKPQPTKKSKKRVNDRLDSTILTPPTTSLKEAISTYAPASSGNSQGWSAKEFTEAADKAAAARDYYAGEALATEAIRINPKYGPAYYLRGRCRCNAVIGHDDGAIQDIKTAIKLGENPSNCYEFLARLYDARKDSGSALSALNEAISLAPRNKHLRKCRAALYLSLGDRVKAKDDYDVAISLDPKDETIRLLRAQLLEALERPDEAVKDYQIVTELEKRGPRKTFAHKRIAAIFSARGKHDRAIAELSAAINSDQMDEDTLNLRGQQYARKGDYKKAIDDFTESLAISPDFAKRRALEERASAYEKLGKTDLAKVDLEAARKLRDAPAEKPVYDFKR